MDEWMRWDERDHGVGIAKIENMSNVIFNLLLFLLVYKYETISYFPHHLIIVDVSCTKLITIHAIVIGED